MTSTLLSDNFLKNVRTSARILGAVNHHFRKRIRREEIVQLHIEGKQFFYSLNYTKIEKINNAIHGLAVDY